MDPFLELHVGSGRIVLEGSNGDDSDEEVKPISSNVAAVSALCFVTDSSCSSLGSNNSENPAPLPQDEPDEAANGLDPSDEDSDGEGSLELQCEALKIQSDTDAPRDVNASSRWLGAALTNGDVQLWDLKQRKVVQNLSPTKNGDSERRLAALRMTRLDNNDGKAVLLHTRDGIISRHDLPSNRTTHVFHATLRATFCAAASCIGDSNLFVAPDVKGAVVVDWRQHNKNVHCIELNQHTSKHQPSHGCIMSLAMLKHGVETMVACGMEDGTIQLRDLRYSSSQPIRQGEIAIGKEPVLSMDMRPSTKDPSSVALIAAGMAGNIADLSSVDATEQGRGVIVKVSKTKSSGDSYRLSGRIRTRFKSWQQQQDKSDSTMKTPEHWYKGNRGAISVCAFDSSDQIVALGGWDYRVRLYQRTSMDGRPLALLRGHTSSITAMDWAPGSSVLATGSADGVVMLWDFPRQPRDP